MCAFHAERRDGNGFENGVRPGDLKSREKKMMYRSVYLLLFLTSLAFADAKEVDDFHWTGVERIVAIGDIHGDYQNYITVLKAAGLVDKKERWSGGNTHLVQTGDIPDRGPDTRMIIAHMEKLAKQAKRKGGRVHNLIGNHEAMNVYGDLRYVSPGEFEAFVERGSEGLRDRYFELYMQDLESRDPEGFAALPEDYRAQWNEKYPLGWVEHRQSWDPMWNPEGEYVLWVTDRKTAIQINDNIFLHGGISGYYCQNSLESLTTMVIAGLKNFDPQNSGILEDEFGPLWYRGLAGEEPQAAPETVDAILERHGAGHIVVGHTPTSGVIWPRYDGKVVQIDTGMSKAYGGYIAYLEITAEGMFAGYTGAKIRLPQDDELQIPYLEEVIALDPDNSYLKQQLEQLLHPPAPEVEAAPETEAEVFDEAMPVTAVPPEPVPIPICGISQ
jgi:hypothetical protein